MHTKKNTNN